MGKFQRGVILGNLAAIENETGKPIIQPVMDLVNDVKAEVQADLAAAEEERDKWRNGLLSLVPAGTEFYHDTNRCVEYVKKRTDGVVENVKRRKEAEAEVAELRVKVKRLKEERDWLYEYLHDCEPIIVGKYQLKYYYLMNEPHLGWEISIPHEKGKGKTHVSLHRNLIDALYEIRTELEGE